MARIGPWSLTLPGQVTKLRPMTEVKSGPTLGKASASAREVRRARLAAALRENLRKRKTQARERGATAEAAPPKSEQS